MERLRWGSLNHSVLGIALLLPPLCVVGLGACGDTAATAPEPTANGTVSAGSTAPSPPSAMAASQASVAPMAPITPTMPMVPMAMPMTPTPPEPASAPMVGDSADPASTPSGMPAASGAPNPSAGCSGGMLAPGRTTANVQVGGQMRDYVLYVPTGYTGSEPVPVTFLLHGGASNASNAEMQSGLQALADAEGFIYIAPNAIGGIWVTTNDSDELFFRDVLDTVGEQGCIDRRRVYSIGCSMGGAMSFWLACHAADVFAAVAPLCGTAMFDLKTDCQPSRPISVMHTIGAQDSLNCWEGEPGAGSPGLNCSKGVLEAFQKIDNCQGEVHETHDGVCETVGECDAGTEVTICKVNTGHILWPATDMDVPQAHWDFLKRFYLP
jgi:polyhydroxybutyrate depolymerase